MHFVQIEFAHDFLLLHILLLALAHGTLLHPFKRKTAPEVPIDVPLKALIKFSQSNQIIYIY